MDFFDTPCVGCAPSKPIGASLEPSFGLAVLVETIPIQAMKKSSGRDTNIKVHISLALPTGKNGTTCLPRAAQRLSALLYNGSHV